MTIVLVAESKEMSLIPLAYKQCPVIVTGVGARVEDALSILDLDKIDVILNVGYCGGTSDLYIGQHKGSILI